MNYNYQPQKIFIEKNVLRSEYVEKILQKFPKIQPQIITQEEWRERSLNKNISLTKGKKTLYLKNFLGVPMKVCPGFSWNAVCCNYYTLDFIENCPLECSYCILQAIHNQPNIIIHANIEEILHKIHLVCTKRPQTNFSIGTGEHSDSLVLDNILELNPILVEFFAKIPNARLELKTKINIVEPLLKLKHNGNTVVSWSLNTEYISKKHEHKTASSKQRVLAAKKIAKSGYFVAFHFDPLIYYEGWKEGYSEMVSFIKENIPLKKIAWVSLGSLRYVPSLKKIAEERFPKSDLFCGEFNKTKDGKFKYISPIRKMLYEFMYQQLKQKLTKVPKYLCMEQENIWNATTKETPRSPYEMENSIRTRIFN